MKRILNTLVGVLLFLILISCSKDNNETGSSFSGTFTSKKYEISPVRLFTYKGEITDINTIRHFIHTSRVKEYFILNTDTIIDIADKMKMEFLPDDKITLINFYHDTESLKIKYKSNVIYFEALDTVFQSRYYFPDDYQYFQMTFPYQSMVTSYFPLYVDTLPSPKISKYWYLIKKLPCYYAIGKRTFLSGDKCEIKFPLLAFLHTKTMSSSFSSEAGTLNNVFKENSEKGMTQYDTLALQQKYIVFRR